jgi:biopolymer transport protein TolR
MGFKTNGYGRGAMAEINVTPLVDVMLVLLIIFMVTAPMMQQGIDVDLPQAKANPIARDKEAKELIISVSRDGKIFVNENEVAESGLSASIQQQKKTNGPADVLLRADKNVPYGTVVRIMASLRAAGISDLGMITTAPARATGNR